MILIGFAVAVVLIMWMTEIYLSKQMRVTYDYSEIKYFKKDGKRCVCILVNNFQNNTSEDDILGFVEFLFRYNKFDTISLFCSIVGFDEHQAHIEKGYHFDVDSIRGYLGDYNKKPSKSFKRS